MHLVGSSQPNMLTLAGVYLVIAAAFVFIIKTKKS